MDSQATKDTLAELLEPWGQTQILRFWDELDDAGKAQLSEQINDIDWERLDALIRDYVLTDHSEAIPAGLTPAPYYPETPETAEQEALYKQARAKAEELLSAGAVGGFTVAGGQGTRLGYDAPKGTFPISPLKNKTLFQLFAESILRTQEKYGSTLPWYIMTSPINDAATRAFFAENDYFGLDPANVMMFPQGTMPAIGTDGKLLLAEKDSLALSPNGHGGSLLALRKSGALADMEKRGVNYISYWQVDNPLVPTFDPLFIGLHAIVGSEMSGRSLTKTGPFEKLGNFCIADGKLIIIEYSDMPEALATQTDAEGRLSFRAGSPATHVLSREFVERLTDGGLHLPVHRANKKVAHVDDDGALVTPEEPNAVKLEMFIFDALPMASQTLILEAKREEQFGPVKNPTGVDSVESARDLMLARAAAWLEDGGVPVPRNDDGSPACRIELSPRRFVDRDDVAAAREQLTPPKAGEEVYYS